MFNTYLEELETADWLDITALAALILFAFGAIFSILLLVSTKNPITKLRSMKALTFFLTGLAFIAIGIGTIYYTTTDSRGYEYNLHRYFYAIGAILGLYAPFELFGKHNQDELALLESDTPLESYSQSGETNPQMLPSDKFFVSLSPVKQTTSQWDPAILDVNYANRTMMISKEGEQPVLLSPTNIKKIKFFHSANTLGVVENSGAKHQINFATRGASQQGTSLATQQEQLNFNQCSQLWDSTEPDNQ